MKFAEKLAKFMYGRNGNDNLNAFIMVIASIIVVANIFVSHFALSIITLLLLALYTWRALSKNTPARRKENAAFLKMFAPISNWIKLTINKIKDRKTHVYKKCPKCKAVLRLPRKKGHHSVICPRCRNKFDVNV